MAKQIGDIKITGTFGGISFYKCGGQHLVRRKGGPGSKQVKTGTRFVRVRENYKEFGNCSKAGKRLRQAVKRWCKVGDSGLYRRLTQLLMKVKNQDTESVRGQRCVSKGLKNESGKALLRHFDFNKTAHLCHVISKPIRLSAFGELGIKALNPGTDIAFTKGATKVGLKALCVQLDLEKGNMQLHIYEEQILKKEDVGHDVLLKLKDKNVLLNSDGDDLFYFVWLAFDDDSNGANDVLCLVDVNKQLGNEEPVKKKRLKKPFKIYRSAVARRRIFVREAQFVLSKKEAPA